jgi:hypothetical protein
MNRKYHKRLFLEDILICCRDSNESDDISTSQVMYVKVFDIKIPMCRFN